MLVWIADTAGEAIPRPTLLDRVLVWLISH
jgi:hypothetical protein